MSENVKAGATMTPVKALNIFRYSSVWLASQVQDGKPCACGSCYLCAYRCLESVTTTDGGDGIAPCLHCGHAVRHDAPAGTVADGCPVKSCNCGYYSPDTKSDFIRGYEQAREDAIALANCPYGDDVQAFAGDEPTAVGQKIATAIAALTPSPERENKAEGAS